MRHDLLARRALLALASTSMLAGCGGSGDDAPGAPAGGGAAKSEEVSTPSRPGMVAMKDIAFKPATLTVKVGEKVTWRNDEAVDHNVVAQEGAAFKSRAFGQGRTYEFTPEKPGTIKYVCTLHPGMDGEIVVEK